jgi:hypothetical protein
LQPHPAAGGTYTAKGVLRQPKTPSMLIEEITTDATAVAQMG